MKFKSLIFAFKEGIVNLGARTFLTIASILTIMSTVFIFLISFCFIGNMTYIFNQVENKIGIQVFFDENLSEDEVKKIAEENFKSGKIKQMVFTSSDEAWEKVKQTYFDNDDTIIEAFNGENPLATSCSYTIYLYDINDQIDIVNRLNQVKGVRKVNYYEDAVSFLADIKNGMLNIVYALIIILSVIAVILISNTITVTAEVRKEENEIKKLIGATNFMVLLPFILEAVIIALIGTTIPFIIVTFSYDYAMNILIPKDSLVQNAVNILNIKNILPNMALFSYSPTVIVSIIVSYISAKITVRV